MTIAEGVSTFGVIAVAGFLVWKEYRSGSEKLDSKIKSNYETYIGQLEKELGDSKKREAQYQTDMGEMKKTINSLKEQFAKETGRLEGQLRARDKQIADLTNTVLNRNPELETVLFEIRDYMKSLDAKQTHQTNILERGQLRNDKIDDATATEEGNVLRNNI